MSTVAPPGNEIKRNKFPSAFGKRMANVFLATMVWAALLFGAAGSLDWLRAWVYLGLYLACLLVNAIALARCNPELAAERGLRRSGTKPFDKVFAALYVPTLFVMPVVAGLDWRNGWTYLSERWMWLGVALQIIGAIPIAWAMATNPHLETTVRIQKERRHRVVTTGPYAYVRHPMYLGTIVQMLAAPLVLGSVWTFVPACAIIVLFVVRTALEDGALQRELPGYSDYADRTRQRLLPGIW